MKKLMMLLSIAGVIALAVGTVQGRPGWGINNLPPAADGDCCFCHYRIDAGPGAGKMCDDYVPTSPGNK